MFEQKPYKVLKMEFLGIKNVITDYTSNGLIGNYLQTLENALNLNLIEEVLYSLNHICIWYNENMSKIMSNEWVFNKEEHKKVKNLLETLNEQLKNYDFKELNKEEKQERKVGNKIFIVHGHDEEAKLNIVRMLEQLELKPIILHEQPDEGNTIIEKIESYLPQASYAIVLYTECDIARLKGKSEKENKFRARQNVVFEHGLFNAYLGRKNVCALVKGNVEIPSDINGVVYVTMDSAGAWKMHLCKNMKAAGISVDLNKLL